MVSWSLSRYFSWGKTISCSGEFTYGSSSPVQFRNYLEVFLFGTHFNETHLGIFKILESRIVQHTSKYPAMHCNLGVYSGFKIAPKITFLVSNGFQQSLFWNTWDLLFDISSLVGAMNGSKPFCTWNKLNSTVSFIKHRMGALSSNHTRINFFKHSK